MIDIACPQCKKHLAIPEQYAGQAGRCNHCGANVVVPLIVAGEAAGSDNQQRAGNRQRGSTVVSKPVKRVLITIGAIIVFGSTLLAFRNHTNTSESVSLHTAAKSGAIISNSLWQESEKGASTPERPSVSGGVQSPTRLLPPAASDDSRVPSERQQVKRKGVTCDTFEIAAELRGDTLSFRLETDLPDRADIMVSVSRSYFEKSDPGTAYSREYFSQKGTVVNWRNGHTCSVADDVFKESLQAQMDKMASFGMPFEVASVADDIEVSFVLPIGQSDPAFGERNSNLHGRMVPPSDLKAIRAEKHIHRPLAQTASEMPRPRTASHDTLEIGSSYRLSRETPLMPEYEPAEPLAAISRMISIPGSSTISISPLAVNFCTEWNENQAL